MNIRYVAVLLCRKATIALTLTSLSVGFAAAQMAGGGMMGGGMMGRYNNGAPAPDLQSPAGRIYSQTCAQCHALPSPVQHTAAQWPGVVQRMERFMQSSGRPVPSSKTLETIIVYLKDHAAGQ
ncbi:MAG: hypothetical protein WCC36_16660 [Gammaproteobacteria bacterium]